MIAKNKIAELVKAGIREILPAAKISRVDVQDDIDSLGERPTLAIIVVFAKRPALKGEDFFYLRRAVEEQLTAAGEHRYPFMRYIDAKELRGTVS
jgi:hypothetical protein